MTRITALVLILATALPCQGMTLGRQQATVNVEEAIQSIREGDFEGGSSALEAARTSLLKAHAVTEVSRVDVYLAVAYFEMSKADVARARLEEAWAWNDKLTLSSADFAPRFISFFNQVRSELDSRNTKESASKKWILFVPLALLAAAGVIYGAKK